MRTRELLIIDVWQPMDKEVVGAAELESIRETILARFGMSVSPASIARALADHGVRLGHPEILQADFRWRENNLPFTPEDLTFENVESAIAFVDKIESMRRQFETDNSSLEHLRQSVRQMKSELDLVALSPTAGHKKVAQELAQWLAVWLENPQIFPEWLALRQATPEYQRRFKS